MDKNIDIIDNKSHPQKGPVIVLTLLKTIERTREMSICIYK